MYLRLQYFESIALRSRESNEQGCRRKLAAVGLSACIEVVNYALRLATGDLRRAGRTSNTRTANAAIALRIPGQVLLMIFLGIKQLCVWCDFGRNVAKTRRAEAGLVGVAGHICGCMLAVTGRIYGGTVLAAPVVTLAHALGRIVIFPKYRQ